MNRIEEKIIIYKEKILCLLMSIFFSTVLFGYSNLIFIKENIGTQLFRFTAFLCCCVVILALLFCVIKKKVIFMCVVLVLMASIYYIKLPVGSGADEANHFYRAYEIASGDLLSKHVDEGSAGGNILPVALTDYENKEAEIDETQLMEISFPNTALYAPVAYLPQAIAIKIAGEVTDNVYTIFMAGRMGAMLINIALSCWALFKMPFAREILFLIMMFPMNMQEMIVMSSDGWTMAVISVFLAYILRLGYKENFSKKEMIILFLLGLSIALSKIVYIIVCLAIFMIPGELFKNRKKENLFKCGFVVAVVVVNLLWLCISYGYMTEFNPGVDSTEQIKYVLQSIPEFYLTSIRTIFANGAFWIQSMFGSSLGALDIPTNWSVWVVYLILIVAAVSGYQLQGKLKLRDNIICLLIFFGGAALIFASLYVQWTAYKNPIIDGIQGRYFIPLLMFLFIPLMSFNGPRINVVLDKNFENEDSKMGILTAFIPIGLNCIALIDIVNFTLQNL